MTPTRIAINGFGRVGRLALRAEWDARDGELAFVHVNELHGDAHSSAHLLAFDSVHGRWDREVAGEGATLTVDDTSISHSSHATPAEVPWADHGVEIVLECSGAFRTMESLQPYFDQGVRKVMSPRRSRTRARSTWSSASTTPSTTRAYTTC